VRTARAFLFVVLLCTLLAGPAPVLCAQCANSICNRTAFRTSRIVGWHACRARYEAARLLEAQGGLRAELQKETTGCGHWRARAEGLGGRLEEAEERASQLQGGACGRCARQLLTPRDNKTTVHACRVMLM
jgi:hypothetical protein